MTVLQVPEPDPKPWPTLGPEVWDWMLANLVYGPGDLRGVPLSDHPPDAEFRGLLYRMYEVFPRDHERAGRRRFRRVALSKRKGTAKTEQGGWISAAELHPEAPVRCDGWKRVGSRWDPVGVSVRDPYIPMVAYTEEQTEDLAFKALYVVISEGPLADDFDIGLERIVRAAGDGKAVPLATAPDARDGARTTFQHFDETGRLTLPRLIEAHQTMQANLVKRKIADPWSLETTFAFAPGESSVAERTHEYATAVAEGREKDSSLFFFHRGASDHHDLHVEDGVRAAVIEASGPAAEWSDIEGIVGLWRDPTTDRAYFERAYTNRLVQQSAQAFDVVRFGELAHQGEGIAPDRFVTGGMDGSRGSRSGRIADDTAITITDLETGHQIVIGHWKHPGRKFPEWEVPEHEVSEVVEMAFDRWNVVRFNVDPFGWRTPISRWQGKYGKAVVEWPTNATQKMAQAVAAYRVAIEQGELSHDGDEEFISQIGNARRRDTALPDGEGGFLYTIHKERHDSPHKIDIAMSAILSWVARIESPQDNPPEIAVEIGMAGVTELRWEWPDGRPATYQEYRESLRRYDEWAVAHGEKPKTPSPFLTL